MRLADKVAIITGGGSGIGRATAGLFAAEGARTIIADRDAAAADRTAGELSEAGHDSMGIGVDVSDDAQVAGMIDAVLDRHGRLDILINNAGFGFAGTVVDTDAADWDALFAVNVRGVYLGCKHAIPVFEKQGGGVIVSTASAGAVVGIPNRAAYTASKGAVAALTRAMAIDHVDAGIRVNCVAPGTIETPYFKEIFETAPDAAKLRRSLESRQLVDRLGTPDEIAKAILFLASDESSFCTGSTLMVDGGWTIR